MLGYYVVGGATLITVIALATVRAALMNSTWSLSDALSEEADITPLGATGKPSLVDPTGKPYLGPDGKALVISELRASSSRFIALIGLIGILMLYLGFGLVILARLGNGETDHPIPDDATIKSIEQLLLYGVIMFAPYIVNKFSSVFDWLKPVK
jgi:hypothetical protein